MLSQLNIEGGGRRSLIIIPEEVEGGGRRAGKYGNGATRGVWQHGNIWEEFIKRAGTIQQKDSEKSLVKSYVGCLDSMRWFCLWRSAFLAVGSTKKRWASIEGQGGQSGHITEAWCFGCRDVCRAYWLDMLPANNTYATREISAAQSEISYECGWMTFYVYKKRN